MRAQPHIHILGICGTFMGGIAAIAREAGYAVVGSDQNVYPPMSDALEALGIHLQEGYSADHLKTNPDTVIVGNTCKRGNEAVEAMLNRKLHYASGPQWLYEYVLRFRHVLAVTGTHGKTTTSALLTWILMQREFEPGYLIGGVAQGFSKTASLGDDEYFVIEADEYDTAFFDKRPKFMHYRPRTLIINNLEFDHADIYADLEAIKLQFHYLLRTIPGNGTVIVNVEDDNIADVLSRGCWTGVETFGEGGDWQAVQVSPDYAQFSVQHQGEVQGQVNWTMIGRHNVLNGLAAIAAAVDVGVSIEDACQALSCFPGVKRRLELRGSVNDIAVYDDFAHHPTAIRATIQGLRRRVGQQRIIAVLQFGSNTMKQGVHKDAIADAIRGADEVVFLQPEEDIGLQAICDALGNKAASYDTVEAIVDHIQQVARPTDHVVVMSNKGFGGIHDKLLSALSVTDKQLTTE